MTKEEIGALEKSIKQVFKSLSSPAFQYVMNSSVGYYDEKDEEDDDEETWIYESLKSLYLMLICYFEIKGLPDYKRLFTDKIRIHPVTYLFAVFCGPVNLAGS